MSDVVEISIAREPAKLAGLKLLDRGIRLEPVDRELADCGKETAGPDVSEQLLPYSVSRGHEGDVRIPENVLPEKKQTKFTSKFESTYVALKDAVCEKNPCEVDNASLGLLDEHPIKTLNHLPELAQKVFHFFDAVGCEATEVDLSQFIHSFERDELYKFLTELAQLVDILKAQAIAAMAQSTLGSTPYNILDMLKYLIAFQVAAIWELRGGFAGDRPIPMDLICQILKAPVFLPEFLFFDPCEWDETKPCEAKYTGALARKMTAKREYIRKVEDKLAKVEAIKTQQKAQSATVNLRENPHPHPDCSPQDQQEDCDCICECEPICLPPDPCCADINFYISDTLVLRDKTHCYVAGDLAYIENIAPYEKRVRTHEFVKTIEDYSEEETTETKSEERDHQVTERYSLQNEIQKDMSASLDVQARYGSGKNKYVQTDAHLSKDVSQSEAREKFRESVNRAVSKLQIETRKLTSRRVTTTETEKNKHKFDNTTPDPAVTKYFYVNKEMEGQVFSYGVAGQVELMIPSPAALYEHLQKLKEERAFDMKKPMHPCLRPSDLNPVDMGFDAGDWDAVYEELLVKYGLTELARPPQTPSSYKREFPLNAEKPKGGGKRWAATFPIEGPEDGYVGCSMRITGATLDPAGNTWLRYAEVSLAGGTLMAANDHKDAPSDDYGPKSVSFSSSETATVRCHYQDRPSIKLEITYCPIPIDYFGWQMEAYSAIMDQYNTDLQAYEEALAEHNRQKEEDRFGIHPFTLKEIILAELKRAAIYMMCEDFERDDVMNMKSEPCGYPEINRSKAAERMWDQYFWDRAFDWEHMSFIFYDYFWNPMCQWPDKFNPGHQDFMFNAFRRAGYVRLVVPCAKGMDGDVYWYTKTRQKWGPGGTLPLNPSDQRWMSVVQELKHSKDCFQNDREGRVRGVLDITQNPVVKSNKMVLQGSIRYWDFFANAPDTLGTIAADLNREVFIQGVAYKIDAIEVLAANDPDYGHLFDISLNANEQWIMTLERNFEGAATDNGQGSGDYHLGNEHHPFAVGAQFVGAPFRWQEPTQLVWIGDHGNKCLPCYPVECE